MKELGITKGEWEAVLTEKVESRLDIAINSDDDCIAWVYSDSLITSKEDECLANAKLIADAGTTANKTGLLPSELLQRYNEAIEVLVEVREIFTPKLYAEHSEMFTKINQLTYQAKQTISKAKP